MEKTLIYFILISSMILPITQVLYSMHYFKRFAIEYLDYKPTSWNPKYDRSAVTFSVAFGIMSVFLAMKIWSGQTDDSWLLTITYLLLIGLFSFFTIFFIRVTDKEKRSSLGKLNKSINSFTNVIVKVNSIERECVKQSFLIIMNNEFKRFDLLDDDFNLDEFENNPPKLKIANADFYLLHKIYVERFKSKITLKEFCSHFKNKKGEFFNYGVVRKDGRKNPNPPNEKLLNDFFAEI